MMKRLDAKIYSADSIFIKNVESSLLLDEHLSLYNSNRLLFFPVSVMSMYISESRVFLTKEQLKVNLWQQRMVDIQLSALCQI